MDLKEQVNQFLSDEEIKEHIQAISEQDNPSVFACTCNDKTVQLDKLPIIPNCVLMYDMGRNIVKTRKELLGVYCYKDKLIEYVTIDGRHSSHEDQEPFKKQKPKFTKLLMYFIEAYLDEYFTKHGEKHGRYIKYQVAPTGNPESPKSPGSPKGKNAKNA